jgi:hypothetical protein
MPNRMHARIMLGLLLAFQLADAATFAIGVGFHGISLEANGFAVLAYHWHGLDGVLILKGAAILLTLGVLVAGATRFPRMFVWGAAAATGLGLLGLATNVTSLMLLS